MMSSTTGETKVVSLYQSQKKIYAKSVTGRFANLRWLMVFVTQAIFYGLAWLPWNGRQAVLFDLGARKFYIFDWIFWPQDVLYLTFILIVSAYSLFFVTAIAGRIFCGYACPQTVYTEIFMWVEKKFEGDRAARMKLDQAPMSFEKAWRKGGKHLAWVLIGLWTGFTFVGYFTPIKTLAHEVLTATTGPWETFWILFYGFATWGNAGFMREQVCKYMCPYARFQSVMFDRDTMIVTYDKERGEPRGGRKKSADTRALNLGSCVDCSLCVQVCPTGIDIRDGLQYECIGCSACIDVCDTVMDKMSYPRGLIRYSTENAVEKHWDAAAIRQHMLRPRILIYFAVLMLLVAGLLMSLALRNPLKVDVIRDRQVLAREVEGRYIENVYKLNVMNTAEQTQKFVVTADGLPDISIARGAQILADPASTAAAVLAVRVPIETVKPGSHPIRFKIQSETDASIHVDEKSVFLIPR
ncbi:MAG TPA: cytochrome c oxidase accessory protein CcoG [Casimicrobium huifangae]|nr:cytochrome c oxidase accessory protein CcoG [Casimicrobium huifangae]HQA34241.1 cytochrome c oxidase accessory protein CcoG [Casimicrobium huifangae]